MQNIIQKIKVNEKLAVIFRDLHLIILITLGCFFVFEKKWSGLISYYIHPAIFIVIWLILTYFNAISAEKKWTAIQLLAGIILVLLILIFYIKSLGPWYWMIILIIPSILLIINKLLKNK